MLGPGFIDRLRRRAEANGGFNPSLLMAVSYRLPARPSTGSPAPTPSSSSHPDASVSTPICFLRGRPKLHPPATGSSLFSARDTRLQHHHRPCDLSSSELLPSPARYHQFSRTGVYQPALLSVDGAGRSFELLFMYQHDLAAAWSLGAQIFSSQEDEWGAPRQIHIHNLPPVPPCFQGLSEAYSAAPAVVGRRVHWLCYITRPSSCELIILALHAESAQASVIKLPQELLTRMGPWPSVNRSSETRILATTATTAEGEKRLSLVVAEALVISTWALVSDSEEGSSVSWSRQVVIRRQEINSQLTSVLGAYQPIQLCMFGERSGVVLFWMQSLALVQLNLGTRKALVVCRDSDFVILNGRNLISVLECMKSF